MSESEHLKKIAFLERRVQREKTSRTAAEAILEEKSKALYEANLDLINAIAKLKKLSTAVEQSPMIVLISDIFGYVEYVNDAFTQISGYSMEDVVGKELISLGLNIDEIPFDGVREVMEKKTTWKADLRGRGQQEQEYQLSISISPIVNDHDSITHLLYNCEDITTQRANEQKIYDLALHDSLTGLYNRYSLDSILQQAISSAQRAETKLSVLFIDMDRFKQINDTHGHKFGDMVLKEVAIRLNAICRRKSDYLARIGGDEFIVVLTDIQNETFCGLTAQAIIESLSLPYYFEEQDLRSSPSVGIAVYPNDGVNATELIKNADAAMYHVKQNGRRKYSFFTKELNKIAEEKDYLEQELRLALENDLLELYYQPQIYLSETRVFGVEALVRWNHASLGFISPEKFITVAEERGLIYQLGAWVLETAFAQQKAWLTIATTPIKMAINLSAKQIENPNFVKDVSNALIKHKVEASMIELEVTESIAMKNPEQSIATLKELRKLGFELAIDDFGTGYSSLSYLKMLPIQTLKLDKTFIDNLEEDQDNVKICKASISLSHDLGLSFVAEGVETLWQASFLKEHKCDVLQGYYFSRPVPSEEAFSYMQSYDWSAF
jgi:diguanylate cyclase (GGDEF)-like protein/PAS domain S-box-containing protein